MPCTDNGVPYPPSAEELLDAKAPAMLCALMRVLEAMNKPPGNLVLKAGQILKRIDWAEAGVTEAEFWAWWRRHKQDDEERRKRAKPVVEVTITLRRSGNLRSYTVFWPKPQNRRAEFGTRRAAIAFARTELGATAIYINETLTA